MEWTQQEEALVVKYFQSAWSLPTLYKRIRELDPSRTYDAVASKVGRYQRNGWKKSQEAAMAELRVGYLDIEATDLDADFGYMLSWYIKPRGSKKYDFSVITKEEIFNYEFDKRLVEELLEAFKNYDILYTHWGADRRFDLPFIRTRAMVHGLQAKFPRRFEKFIFDTWPIARNKLKLHSNRLDSIAEAAQIKGVKKTPLKARTWQLAAVGHPESLEYIAKHNRHDVIILERVHRALELYENKIYRSM